tara:strand:+ start:1720 stop:1914 length:195 start_codon:yes stop_codon:yes gene_type:complete
MYVLKGEFEENIYKHLSERGYYMIDSKVIQKNQCSHINDEKGFHSMKNLSYTYGWSLHNYKDIK